MGTETTNSCIDEVPVEHLREKANASSLSGDIRIIFDELLVQLQNQRSKDNVVVNALLTNKTLITEVQTQAERTARDVERVEKQVDQLAMLRQTTDDKLERFKRQNDVIIRGIPLLGKEKRVELLEMLKLIGAKINCQLSDRDIEAVRVLSGRGDHPQRSLMARFSTVTIRHDFFHNYLAVPGGLRASCFGRSHSERIYISDNLTPLNQNIRNKAAALVRDGRLESQVTRDGLIFAKRASDPGRRPIYSVEELISFASADNNVLTQPVANSSQAGPAGLVDLPRTSQRINPFSGKRGGKLARNGRN